MIISGKVSSKESNVFDLEQICRTFGWTVVIEDNNQFRLVSDEDHKIVSFRNKN